MPPKTASRPAFRCDDCGTTAPRWVGRCPECQAWGTVREVGAPAARTVAAGPVSTAALPMPEIDVAAARARTSGVPELDRVLGGGLVRGAVILLAGEPGVGKSTLLLDVANRFATPATRALIVTGEESTAQVRLRAGRTGALNPDLYLAAETDLAALLGHVEQVDPALLVVDSIQTLAHPDVDGAAGGVTQVRECTAAVIRAAKQRGMTTVIVGHVTKDGAIAGPRVLEHLVDVVLQFEGERHTTLRLVRASKNRYGPADEVGCFELTDSGISGIPDPTGLFVNRRTEPVSGACVTVTIEGRRPMLAEIQALTAKAQAPPFRRATSGLDPARLAMILAVLEQRADVRLASHDVYASTVGGHRINDPAADLALALAVASSVRNTPMHDGVIVLGEVGLTGEVRPVTGIERRLAEAARLGFTHAIVPPAPGRVPGSMRVISAGHVRDAVASLRPLRAVEAQ